MNASDKLSIACLQKGYPIAEFSWKYNLLNLQYVNMKASQNITFATNSTIYLDFDNIERRHNGTYACITEDETVMDTIEIVVQSKSLKNSFLKKVLFF